MTDRDLTEWVKDYQARAGLVVDGIVGPFTWASVMGAIDGLNSRVAECEMADETAKPESFESAALGMAAGAAIVLGIVWIFG